MAMIALALTILLCVTLTIQTDAKNLEDVILQAKEKEIKDFTEVSSEFGYASEPHTVTTEDGYILTIFRMLKGKKCTGQKKSPPILLQHGLLMTASSWLYAGPSAGLAFMLADDCYDVFCGSTRGGKYGRRHVYLDPDTDDQFWDFTYDEMGKYDVPAMIDYILGLTKSDNVNYIGHSQGGGVLYVLGATRPEYLDKINIGVTLAPGTIMKHTRNVFFKIAAANINGIEGLLEIFDVDELFDENSQLKKFIDVTCQNEIAAGTLCAFVYNFLFDSEHIESVTPQTLSRLANDFPDACSVKDILHFVQATKTEKFQMYDYGSEEDNKQMYNSTTPPEYNVSGIDVPVCLFSGLNDQFVDVRDVATLASQLPNVIENSIIDNPKWNHCDFILSQYIPIYLYPKIIKCLQYSTN